MFKMIVRPTNANIVRLIRTISFSANIIDSEKRKIESTSFNMIKKSSAQSNSEIKSIRQSDQIEVLINCTIPSDLLNKKFHDIENVVELLNIIEPIVHQLTSDHLSVVYGRIFSLSLIYKRRSNRNNQNRPWINFIETLESSNVFKQLIERTIHLDGQLSCDTLCRAFSVFDRIQLDPDQRVVQLVVKNMEQRIDQMSLIEILQFIDTFNSYSRHKKFANNKYSLIYESLLEILEEKIEADKFDRYDVDLLRKCFIVSLRSSSAKVVNKIMKLLLLSANQLNFRNSVELLNIIKAINREKPQKFASFENLDLNALIEKCNSSIYSHLKSNSIDIWHFLKRMHTNRNARDATTTFKNLYPLSILDLILPTVITEPRNPYLIIYLFQNYASSNKYDERLLNYIHHLMCSNDKIRKRMAIDLLTTLSNLRMPFLPVLVDVLLKYNSQQIYQAIANDCVNGLKLINILLLNDTEDGVKLSNCLNKTLSGLRKISIMKLNETMSKETFEEFCLSRVYFSLFNQVNLSWKTKIIDKLNELFYQVLKEYKRPEVDNRFLGTQIKLKNGYLSNGLYVETYGIFDCSANCLIPMSDSTYFFHKIDKTPVHRSQKLLIFNETLKLQGNISHHVELNASHKLKQVLNRLKIKSIDVFKDELINLPDEKREQFLVAKILGNYRFV